MIRYRLQRGGGGGLWQRGRCQKQQGCHAKCSAVSETDQVQHGPRSQHGGELGKGGGTAGQLAGARLSCHSFHNHAAVARLDF